MSNKCNEKKYHDIYHDPKESEDKIIFNKKELYDFINFLSRISARKPGEKIDLVYTKGNAKSQIILIGRPEIINKHGPTPYYYHIKEIANNSIDVFYILARGRVNCWIAKFVAQKLEKDKIIKVTDRFKDKVKYEDGSCPVVGFQLKKLETYGRKVVIA